MEPVPPSVGSVLDITVSPPDQTPMTEQMSQDRARTFSDERLKGLAQAEPFQLASLLKLESPPGDLARYASAANFVADREAVRSPLVSLALGHPSQLVREACLQGLDGDDHAEVFVVIERMAERDESPIVREIAMEMLCERCKMQGVRPDPPP